MGTKKRVNSSKGMKWKKGHSSDSNPVCRKHRDGAKKGLKQIEPSESSAPALTGDVLEQHNKQVRFNLPAKDGDVDMDAKSLGGETATTFRFDSKSWHTYATFATNKTGYTNKTYASVFNKSNEAEQMKRKAMLEAVRVTIAKKGTTGSDVAYFMALMAYAEKDQSNEDLTVIFYLVNKYIHALARDVPQVLRPRKQHVPVDMFAKTFINILNTHRDSECSALIKDCLMCVKCLLEVQCPNEWTNESTKNLYTALLHFTGDSKPKVRRLAQQAVRVILKKPQWILDGQVKYHPAANMTSDYIISKIKSSGVSNMTTMLHMLGLLEHVLGCFPVKKMKEGCEAILNALMLADVTMTRVSLRSLHGMFVSKPRPESLPAEMNARIITALYTVQPGVQDTDTLGAWLTVMAAAHNYLATNDAGLCLERLPQLVVTCMNLFKTERISSNTKTASKTLTSVFESSFPLMESLLSSIGGAAKQSGGSTAVHKIIRALDSGLNYHSQPSWATIINLFKVFFECAGRQVSTLCAGLIQSLAGMREIDNFPHLAETDNAVGAAVKTMGPRAVLAAVPLLIEGEETDDYNFPRSWLLPVLKQSTQNTDVAYFLDYFVPLAKKCSKRATIFKTEGRDVECVAYMQLKEQIWALLPGFCTHPTDLSQSYDNVAKCIGPCLKLKDLRMTVLTGLRRLTEHCLEDEASKTVAVRSKFTPMFLQSMFSMYSEDQPDDKHDKTRMAVLETIKVLLVVIPEKLIAQYFDQCLIEMKAAMTKDAAGEKTMKGDDDKAMFQLHALMDLVIVTLQYVDVARLENVFPIIVGSLTHKNKTVQKKSYRMLEEMSGAEASDACKALVREKFHELRNSVVTSLSQSARNTRAPALRFLGSILDHELEESEENQKFLEKMLTEAIMCTKETAEKGRQAAFSLVSKVALTFVRWSGGDEEKALTTMFTMMLPFLALDDNMVSCTLLAYKKIVVDFENKLTEQLVSDLCNITCRLLMSKSRQVVVAALDMLKVLISRTDISRHLKDIVDSLVTMKDDNKHHLRFKNKEIYTRLIRKFSYEIIHKMVPVSHHKIIINIKKSIARAKKQEKEQKDKDGSDDDDSDDEMKPKSDNILEDVLADSDDSDWEDEDDEDKQKKGKKGAKKGKRSEKHKVANAWLKDGMDEDGEEMIIDFLDPSAKSKVMGTKPLSKAAEARAKSGVKHDFKTDARGKLVITEGGDNDEQDKKYAQKRRRDDDDEDLEDNAKRMKKSAPADVGDWENISDAGNKPGYKPGGAGIHRYIGGKKQFQKKNPAGKAKKVRSKGESKKKGQIHDPFLYVPLDKKVLNRRNKKKTKHNQVRVKKSKKMRK